MKPVTGRSTEQIQELLDLGTSRFAGVREARIADTGSVSREQSLGRGPCARGMWRGLSGDGLREQGAGQSTPPQYGSPPQG